MNVKIKSFNIKSVLLFFIGFTSCSDILSAFVVGSTPIMIANVLALVLLSLCVISHNGKLIEIAHYLTKDLLYLGIFILFSIVQVLFLNPGNIYQWFVGIINLLLYFILIMAIIESKDETNALLWGLVFGVFVNFVISIYSMILYNSGIIFDLAKYFPHEYGIGEMYLSNDFRARGLFKEQGHLMRFLAIIAIPTAQFIKPINRMIYFFYIAALAFMMAFTGSSSVAFFLFGFIFFIIITNGKSAAKIVFAIFVSIIVVFGLLYLGRSNTFIFNLLSAFQMGFSSIFDTTGANSSRIQGMKYAIEIIKDYPIIGCGWNNFTKVFMSSGFYGTNYVMGSYSEALTIIAELGLASLFYFYFIISKGAKLLTNTVNKSSIGFGISLFIYFALFCSTDYSIDPGSSVFIALTFIQYNNWHDELTISNNSINKDEIEVVR